MNRMVYAVFKAIMVAVIFVFVWDMVFYMYRVFTLNSRMESLSTSLKKVVMDNNYLPSEQAVMFQELLAQMICDYNQVAYTGGMSGSDFLNSNGDNFIAGFKWNYNSEPVNAISSIMASRQKLTGGGWTPQSENIVNTRMDIVGDYGDICVVQLRVGVYQPMWNWTSSTNSTYNNDYDYDGQDSTYWTRFAQARVHEFIYTYYVPCLNYKTITNL